MSESDAGRLFVGGLPAAYEQLLVPLFFEPYADDLVARANARRPSAVLELAAGTGVVTRRLAAALPAGCTLVATDLNAGMIDVARGLAPTRPDGAPPVDWRVADAQDLPFPDGSFDLVLCQFGVMFFPDRVASYAEAARVLRPGGAYLLSAWGPVGANAVAQAVDEAYRRVLPDADPNVITRVAHGYHDADRLRQDLEAGGFVVDAVETLRFEGTAPSPQAAAITIPRGSPLRAQLEPYGTQVREDVEAAATALLAERFGDGPLRAPMTALVATASRP
ncbi:class I SAM-dependent methyltransferase [Luteimicrobium sp. NPDC057192]|uniref:class I SAM-dependent methyltransferase n=1 Tax=Luteimicrobium sp. NPDC057192 TaxID=3346042 RepID=UPI00363E1363